jgi:catechol 2,3-dioxygenase-like lactoylglutathione lyase family enzyme
VAFVPTKDTEKARAFYEGVLGLRFVKDDGFGMVLDANGIMVWVAKAQFTPAPFTILGWQVPEIEKMVEGLQAKGVREVWFLRAGCARNLDRAWRGQGGLV